MIVKECYLNYVDSLRGNVIMYYEFIDIYTDYFCISDDGKKFFIEEIQKNQINNFDLLLESNIEICITHPFNLFFNDGMTLEGWEDIDNIEYFKCIANKNDEPIILDSRTNVLFFLKFGSLEKYELSLNINDFMSILTMIMIEYKNFMLESSNDKDMISVSPVFLQKVQNILSETKLHINSNNLFYFLFG